MEEEFGDFVEVVCPCCDGSGELDDPLTGEVLECYVCEGFGSVLVE